MPKPRTFSCRDKGKSVLQPSTQNAPAVGRGSAPKGRTITEQAFMATPSLPPSLCAPARISTGLPVAWEAAMLDACQAGVPQNTVALAAWAWRMPLHLPRRARCQVSHVHPGNIRVGPRWAVPLLLGRFPPMALSGSELWPALRRREEAAESPAGGIRALPDKYLALSSTGRIGIRACGRDGHWLPCTALSDLAGIGF